MKALSPDRLLQRAPNLRLRLLEDGGVEIAVGEAGVMWAGAHALAVLDVFSRPLSFRAAIARLRHRAAGAQDWADLSETVRRLTAGGALIHPADVAPAVKAGAATFSGAPIHIRMLDDRVRTSRLLAAIAAVVRPGDVVVEVGTGTGVLAVAAARAGARHVYAIEAGAMAAAARQVIAANGVADRVTVIEGWSTAVVLPERGNVFVSETIGSAAFDEDLVAIARDAVERHLQPDARMIPRRLELFALPVEASRAWLAAQRFAVESTHRWREWYGIDFEPLNAIAVEYNAQRGLARPGSFGWPVLADPLPLARAGFGPAVEATKESASVFTAREGGELNALVFFFEAELAPGLRLSTDPRQPAEQFPTNWGNPIRLVRPWRLEAGERLRLDFAWDNQGRHRCELTRA